MIIGDINGYLGSAEVSIVVLSSIFVFLTGVGLVAWLSLRFLGMARYGLTVYVGMVLIACVITLLFGPFFLGADGPQYDLQAVGVASTMRGDRTDTVLSAGKEGWPVILGVAYFVLGRVPFVGILLSCIAVGASSIFVARTAELLHGNFSFRMLFGWYFFTPLFLLLGPSLMRESLCWLAVSMLSYGVVAFTKGNSRGAWPAAAGALALLSVRTSLAVLVLGALAVSWLVLTLIQKKMRLTLFAVAVSGTAFASALLSTVLETLGFSEQSLQANRIYISADATTGFATSNLQSGVGGIILTAGKVFPRLLLGPFPWELGLSPVWIWVAFNTVAWLALLVTVVRRMPLPKNRQWWSIMVVAVGLLLLGMSLSLTNYGIIVRMRGTPMIMLLPLVLSRLPAVKLIQVPTSHGELRPVVAQSKSAVLASSA